MQKGQMQIVFGVAVVLIIVGMIFGFQWLTGSKDDKSSESSESPEVLEPVAGTETSAAPIRSNLFPTGTLPAGTTQTKISISINKPGYCRYSTKSGQPYDSMRERFSSDSSKTLHTDTVKGLTDNKIFEYYVRCRDSKGNENTNDAIIRFGVGGVSLPSSPTTPGQDAIPPYLFAPWPDDEDLPYTTKKVVINLKTDEKAVCRYGTASGLSYYSMNRIFSNTNSTYHSTEVTGLSEGGEYKYYIKCADENENINADDLVVSFTVEEPEDLIPPIRSNLWPEIEHPIINAPTGEITISLRTDEPAYCRYDFQQGTPYKSMKYKFSRSIETSHYKKITVEQYKIYNIFIRCKDMAGNANTGDVMLFFKPY